MPYSIIVLGAAGCGKSTLVQSILDYSTSIHRRITPVNLDPSISTTYPYDITHHITTTETMETYRLGPNGAIIKSLNDFLSTYAVDDDDEYYIYDCPGQIELLMSSDILKDFVLCLNGNKVVFYVSDAVNNKEISSLLCGLVCALRFNVPIINVTSKVDLISEEQLEDIVEMKWLYEKEHVGIEKAMCELIVNTGYNCIMPASRENEELIGNLMYQADILMQYYDNCEPKETIT